MNRIICKELRLRVTRQEHEKILREAHTCGLTVSEYIRKRLRGEPLIHRPTQSALQHFHSLQELQVELMPLLNKLPREDTLRAIRLLGVLIQQGRQMI